MFSCSLKRAEFSCVDGGDIALYVAEKCGIMVSCFISLQPELHAVVVAAVEGCADCSAICSVWNGGKHIIHYNS